MTWQLIVIPEVKDDLDVAANWYAEQRQDLALAFIDEVDRTINDLLKSPLTSRLQNRSKNVRWVYTARFPYRVIYQVLEAKSLVIIIAITHCARSNRSWRNRA